MKKIIALLTLLLLPAAVQAAGPDAAALRLVVQQDGQSLVTEERQLDLPKGHSRVVLPDLPAAVQAQTLQVRSLTAPKAMRVLDFALDAEALSQAALLRRHLGETVLIVVPDGKSRDGRVQKTATVLGEQEPPVFLVDGRVYAGPVESVSYPGLPAGLSSRPSLAMTVDNAGPARQTLELSYLTRELSWSMDYVLTLNKAGDSALLSGWVTISNRCGRAFPEATVELLSGEGRAPRPMLARAFGADTMVMAKAAPEAQEEEAFEQHLYRLPRPVSLADQQSRQTRLFEAATVPVTRRLVGRASALPNGREADPVKQKLDVLLSFRNTGALGLGMPLPSGTLRAFQEDGRARRLVGEARLDRVPVGSQAELRLGQAFDLTVERVPTAHEKTGKNNLRAAWELRIHNGKAQAQRIVLQELMPGAWKIEAASAKWTRVAAGVAEFVLDVPPTRDGKPLVLTYSYSADL